MAKKSSKYNMKNHPEQVPTKSRLPSLLEMVFKSDLNVKLIKIYKVTSCQPQHFSIFEPQWIRFVHILLDVDIAMRKISEAGIRKKKLLVISL